jgi:hypothetical protein
MELTSLQKWTLPSPNSGLPPSASLCIMPDRGQMETFFVFPNADDETEDAEDETETDEDIQDTAGLEEEVPSDDEENDL